MKRIKQKKYKSWFKWIIKILIIGVIAFGIYWLVTNWDSFFQKEELPTIPTQGGIEVTYFLNDEEYNKQFYSEGDTLQLLDYPQIADKEVFLGWLTKDDKYVSNKTKVENDLNLYGYIIERLDFRIGVGDCIDKYLGNATEVVIPASYSENRGVVVEGNDYQIKGINLAFNQNKSLTSINIPESVIYINERAFSGCTSLTTLYVHNYKIYSNLTPELNIGRLVDYVTNYYILASIDDGTNPYFSAKYTKSEVQIDGQTYNLYTPNTEAELIVKFYDFYGNVVETKIVQYGEVLGSLPEVPSEITWDNKVYTFLYWFGNNEFKPITETTQVYKDINLQAYYEPEEEDPIKPPITVNPL